jgi:hypothetical protein
MGASMFDPDQLLYADPATKDLPPAFGSLERWTH